MGMLLGLVDRCDTAAPPEMLLISDTYKWKAGDAMNRLGYKA